MGESLSKIMEGECPVCDDTLVLTWLAGTPEFIAEYQDAIQPHHVLNTWEEVHGDTDGVLCYLCTECDQMFEVYRHVGGDWTEG